MTLVGCNIDTLMEMLMQRALVGATEGIAWELLWTLTSIKQAQGKPQSLADMVNEALPGIQKGSVRKGLSLKGVQRSLHADSSMCHTPTKVD